MAEKKLTKSPRVSISKRKLANTAGEMQEAAVIAGTIGMQETLRGAERLETAGDMADTGAVLLAKGASDITQAADVEVMSARMAVLSDAVAVAGIADITEGAEILAGSEDVGVMSALVGMMSAEDIEHGLELARLSGELQTASEMLAVLKMPVLSNLLSERAARLHEMSVEQIRHAISADGVSQVLAATGKRIGTLGENEVEEGMARLTISEAASAQSAALSKASVDLTVQGIEEMAFAGEVTQVARAEAMEGAAEISSGSAVVGAAIAMDEMAASMKEKSEEK
jgi:hypothetical protein